MISHIDRHVGKRIRHRRWMIGMTEDELGRRIDIGLPQIRKYESGIHHVTASRLYDIAAALEVSVDFFFIGLKRSPDQAVADDEGDGDSEAVAILRFYHAIPAPQRRQLLYMARTLSETAIRKKHSGRHGPSANKPERRS